METFKKLFRDAWSRMKTFKRICRDVWRRMEPQYKLEILQEPNGNPQNMI